MAQPLKWLAGTSFLLWAVAAWAVPVQLEMLQEPLSAPEEATLYRALSWMVQVYEHQGLHPNPSVRIRVFATYPEFRAYQASHRSFQDGSRPSRSAYYSIGRHELVSWRNRGIVPLLIHESQHALLRSDYARPPKWLNEGLSECFEGFDFSQEVPLALPQVSRLRKVKHLLNDDFGPKVVEVLTMNEREFNGAATDRGLDSYTRSWALVYFLWSQPNGEDCIGELLRGLRRGETAGDVLARLINGPLDEQINSFYRALPDPPEPTT